MSQELCEYNCKVSFAYQCSRWGSLCQVEFFHFLPLWQDECTFEDRQTCPLVNADYKNIPWEEFHKWRQSSRHNDIGWHWKGDPPLAREGKQE